MSYDCYSKLIKKCPFLKDQTEMLFLFIKDYYSNESERNGKSCVFISDEINEWIQGTWTKYQVNLLEFAYRWIEYFYDNEDIWTAPHRRKSQASYRKYEYDIKKKSNLFNIDSLYIKMPKKAFTKGIKREFEILMMYYWIHSMVGDDEDYWQEYLEKTLPELKGEIQRLKVKNRASIDIKFRLAFFKNRISISKLKSSN